MKKKIIFSVVLTFTLLINMCSVFATVVYTAPEDSRATAPKYNVTKGVNGSFTGSETLTFLTDGDGVDYKSIYVDLIELELGEDYVMGGDNGLFKIKPEFLKTLKDGKHELIIIYVDGYALTTFTTKGGDGTAKPTVQDAPTTGIITTGPNSSEVPIGALIGPTEEQATGKKSANVMLLPIVIFVLIIVVLCIKKNGKNKK